MAQILFDCDVPAENAIYIGDSYKDGAEAATVSPPLILCGRLTEQT